MRQNSSALVVRLRRIASGVVALAAVAALLGGCRLVV
jgi:hypothetical protein